MPHPHSEKRYPREITTERPDCVIVGPVRYRVKMLRRVIGHGMPDNAEPGDLVLGNRGAGARVMAHHNSEGGCLYFEYAGNWGLGGSVRSPWGGKVYDFR